MSKLTVIKKGNEHLRRVAKPVAVSDIASKPVQKLIVDMIETMKKENGVGIAAPQVDVNERVIIVEREGVPMAIVNPQLSALSFAKVESEEGCLSVPGVWGIVKRHRSLAWKGYDDKGKEIGGRATGFFAIVLQHEVDHLNGVLFVDKVERYIDSSDSRI